MTAELSLVVLVVKVCVALVVKQDTLPVNVLHEAVGERENEHSTRRT